MPEKLKDILMPADQIGELANALHSVYPEFDVNRFTNQVFDQEWAHRELKQKMRHITICLKQNLPDNYKAAISILEKVAPKFRSFIALSFSDFVECYGMDHWDISMNALTIFTCSCSSEFAVRPFLDKNPEKTMEYFYRWPTMRTNTFAGCRAKAAVRVCPGEWCFVNSEKTRRQFFPSLKN